MGAANVLRVYHSWRQHLDDRPFCVLVYMALRARDRDAEPWYGAGHDELGQIALGLPVATERDLADARRIVRRAMTQLRRAGAIRTLKAAARGRHARYRLCLDGPTEVTERPMENSANSHERRSLTDLRPAPNVGHSVTFEHQNVGHSVAERRSLSDLPIQEEEEEEELQGQERISPEANLRTANCGRHPTGPVNGFAKPAIRADSPTP